MKPESGADRSWKAALLFVLYCLVVAVLYGTVHDLVTAHVAVEYFSIHHAKVIESDNPIALALVWGFLATFWVGLLGGAWLVLTNLVGPTMPLKWQWLRRGVLIVAVASLTAAMLILVSFMWLTTLVPMAERKRDFENDRRLISVAMAHLTSYMSSAVLTFGLGIWVFMTRKQLARKRSEVRLPAD
ncbi:MAG: hypothetical protein HONBIEJF_00999 [Fimbriimonadaceae bacterium]|nr:hypothetical protein [Fimbriimonadaceae bacterium]